MSFGVRKVLNKSQSLITFSGTGAYDLWYCYPVKFKSYLEDSL